METAIAHLEKLGGERRIRYSLDAMAQALNHVGNPHRGVQSVVIGGTNGKGTTTLLLSSALVASGRKVATYLSPHLQSPVERFLCNLQPIEEETFHHWIRELFRIAEKFELTYFEYLTFIFFMWAKETKAEILVLEVGLGGRLDATNVTEPETCVITNIALDHEHFLGNTPEKILAEKMGILRKGCKVFTALEKGPLYSLLENRCAELDAQLYSPYSAQVLSRNWDGQTLLIDGTLFRLHNPSVGTAQNAALSFNVVRNAFPEIALSTIQNGFERIRTPGRLEVIQENPRVVLSGDHNPHGLFSLKESLDILSLNGLEIICAFSADKPYFKMFEFLKKLTPDIHLTRLARTLELPEDYRALAPLHEDSKKLVLERIARAKPDVTILVTGSLYLVGEVRSLWKDRVLFSDNSEGFGKEAAWF